jgi:D-3-phosphoglycerate dehydrogenase
MPRPVVLLTSPIDPMATKTLAAHAEIRTAPATDAASLRAAVREADVIIVRAQLPEDVFDAAPRMRAAVRHGAGVDLIPVTVASRLGIAVANVPSVNAPTVAEVVVGQMLSLAHRLTWIHMAMKSNGWAAARPLSNDAIELAEKTVGIIGVGAVGTEIARICHAGLRMRVLGFRRRASELPVFVTPASLDELLAASDCVVLACPLTDETRGLLDAPRIARMKPTATLINVSRRAVIYEPALIQALQERCIAGAALDVFATQPLPAESPLVKLDNVLLSPHIAGITLESTQRMSVIAVDETLRVLRGERPNNFVNADAWSAIQARWAKIGKVL